MKTINVWKSDGSRPIGVEILAQKIASGYWNKKHLKNVVPIRHNEPPHANSPGPGVATVLSHAACASMSTTPTMTTTISTTRDRGDRYGPMEWAQKRIYIG